MTAYAAIPIAGGDTDTPLSREKRLAVIRRHVPSGPGVRVLDCGCGSGGYVRLLRRELGAEALGLEYQADKVAEAQRHPDVAPYVIQGDIQRMPYEAGSFDVVWLNEVIEHVPDEMRSLAEIRRVLKPGGRLIVFAPNRRYPFETHGVFLRGSDTKVPPWVPLIPYVPVPLGRLVFRYWARNYWPRELRALLGRAGFTILERAFFWQTFENISGSQPRWIARCKAPLRAISRWGEKSFLKGFGISQIWVCQK